MIPQLIGALSVQDFKRLPESAFFSFFMAFFGATVIWVVYKVVYCVFIHQG